MVFGTQPHVNISFDYADESDPGPYPIPPNAQIEGGPNSTGDRHVLVLDRDNCVLYEMYSSYPQPNGTWQAGSGAVFGLESHALRPRDWTSADAAGLPILPGLVRYDEVAAGEIAHALRFTVPQFQVTQLLDVPAGSAVVLQNIELQPDGVVAQAVHELDFFGTVDLVDCADHTLLVHGRGPDDMQVLVHLDDRTSVVDAAGRTQSCTAIRVGLTVAIEGTVAYATDRTVSALTVTIAPRPPSPPPPVIDVPFSGTLAALDCNADAGFIVIDDSVQRTSLELTPNTDISDAMGALGCQGLQLGDLVRGRGQINLRMPGVIVASDIRVIGPPNSGQSLRFVGFVNLIDCVTGTLQLNDVTNTIDVQLSSTTVITSDNGQPLTCNDIQPGDRVVGLGQVPAGGTSLLDAVHITIKTHGRPNRRALDATFASVSSEPVTH